MTTFSTKYESLPAELKKEVENFIDFLMEKERKKSIEVNPEKKERPLGLAKGLIEMSPDFDEPLEDFKDYM